jgi:hypothetical protein
MTFEEFRSDREKTREAVVDARNAGVKFFRLLGYLDDSSERTSAMGRAEESLAYVDRVLDKIK